MQGPFSSVAKILIGAGILLVAFGLLLLLFNKGSFMGKLPGDIIIRKKNFTFYFPVVTSIIISLVLTLVFYLINRFKQ